MADSPRALAAIDAEHREGTGEQKAQQLHIDAVTACCLKVDVPNSHTVTRIWTPTFKWKCN